MGRSLRLQFPGACYHVTLRGNNGRPFFLDHQDKRRFLALLEEGKRRRGLKVYAYCLLDDHIDLLLETAQGNLSSAMQCLCTAYTKYFNRRHDSSGHLFQGRYGALLVDKDAHLLELTRNIHLAPSRVGIREKPWRYPWSSCPAYVESEEGEPLVESEAVLRLLAKNRLKQSVRYLHYIQEGGRGESPELPCLRGLFVGDEAFADSAMKRAGVQSAQGRGVKIGAATAQSLLAEVAAGHGVDASSLTGRGRWRTLVEARRDAVRRLWEAGLGVTEIARLLHRTPSAVSQVLRTLLTPVSRAS